MYLQGKIGGGVGIILRVYEFRCSGTVSLEREDVL